MTGSLTQEVYTYKSSWILTLNIFANRFRTEKYSPAHYVMDFLNIQDGEWLVSLSFNISETKHVIKKLTTDIIITYKVLIDKSKRKCTADISSFIL